VAKLIINPAFPEAGMSQLFQGLNPGHQYNHRPEIFNYWEADRNRMMAIDPKQYGISKLLNWHFGMQGEKKRVSHQDINRTDISMHVDINDTRCQELQKITEGFSHPELYYEYAYFKVAKMDEGASGSNQKPRHWWIDNSEYHNLPISRIRDMKEIAMKAGFNDISVIITIKDPLDRIEKKIDAVGYGHLDKECFEIADRFMNDIWFKHYELPTNSWYYPTAIQRWKEVFGDKVLVVFAEDLQYNTEDMSQIIRDHLSLDEFNLDSYRDTSKREFSLTDEQKRIAYQTVGPIYDWAANYFDRLPPRWTSHHYRYGGIMS